MSGYIHQLKGGSCTLMRKLVVAFPGRRTYPTRDSVSEGLNPEEKDVNWCNDLAVCFGWEVGTTNPTILGAN
jgi:hypothetical protein